MADSLTMPAKRLGICGEESDFRLNEQCRDEPNQDLVSCSASDCPKTYHIACLNIDKRPT
ncbi:unnamed protein product, partial [Protopolystoma xenopodis]